MQSDPVRDLLDAKIAENAKLREALAEARLNLLAVAEAAERAARRIAEHEANED